LSSSKILDDFTGYKKKWGPIQPETKFKTWAEQKRIMENYLITSSENFKAHSVEVGVWEIIVKS